MLATKYRREELVTTSGALDTVYQLEIPTSRRRLEAIIIMVGGNATTLTTPTVESFGNILTEVSLVIDDGALRPHTQANAIDLLLLWDQWGGQPPAVNRVNIGRQTTGAFQVVYPLWLRHPLVEDPTGIFTALPMWRLGGKPKLSLRTAPASGPVAATLGLTGGLDIRVHLYYRNDTSDAYLPSQVVTWNQANIPLSSRYDANFPQGGWITCWNASTYINAGQTTKGSLLGASGLYELYYGTEHLDTFSDLGMQYRKDLFQEPPFVYNSSINFSFGDDLLYDLPLTGGFQPRTALNLNPVPIGDLYRLSITQTAASGTLSMRTIMHKFLENPANYLTGI